MADNRRYCAAVLCILCASAVCTAASKKKKGQTPEPAVEDKSLIVSDSGQTKSYYIKDTEEGAQFVQQFSWTADPNALRYEFFIAEQNADETWKDPIITKTDTASTEVSLPAGTYRYKVRVYNLLDLPESETEWSTVSIVKAYEPKVDDASPKLMYLEEENNGIFTVSGEQLRPDTKFYLIPNLGKGKTAIPGTVIESDRRNRKVRVQFDIKLIDVSKYALAAVNPGGLTATWTAAVVKFKKPFDLDVSAGYMPVCILADDTIKTYFGSSIWPAAVGARVTIIPVKRRIGYFGIALAGSVFTMKNEQSTFTLSTTVTSVSADLVYQHYLYKRRLMLDIHAGAGIVSFRDMKFEFAHSVTSSPLNADNLSATGGLALQFYIQKRLYTELGIDYTHVFMSDMQLDFIQPEISAGWQF